MFFDKKYEALKSAIGEIISVQQELQSQHDRLEIELRGLNQQFQKAVMENPGGDHGKLEFEIGKIEKQLRSFIKKLSVFPEKFPDEADIAKQIAEGKADGLRESALEVLKLGINEVNTIQEQIDNLVSVQIPALKERAVKLATETGNLERRKTEVFERLKFTQSCAPDVPDARFKPRRSTEWPQVVIDENEVADSFDKAK